MMVRGRAALDWEVVEQAGQKAASIGQVLPSKFTKDSFHKPSEAKTTILEEPDVFANLSAALTQAGQALTMAAQKRDEGELMVAFVSYAQSCKDCHSLYRE
jgi:cytochrome c556